MKFYSILGCLAVALCNSGAVLAEGRVTVILAGHLIDTDTGRVLDAQTVVVRDGIISEVGSSIAAPRDARVVDLRAYTVMPGLIDAHTHLTIDSKDQDPLAELDHTA